MVKNTINTIVNPETPNVNPKQQLFVYVPVATNQEAGIAKFYAEHFSVVDGLVKISKDYVELLNSFPLKAEGFAIGEQNGVAVTSGIYYQNNAKYYCEQASIHSEDSLTNANSSKTSAEDAKLARDAVYKYINIIDNGIFSTPYDKTEQVINSDITITGTLKAGVIENANEVSLNKLNVVDLHVTGTSTVENAKNLQLEDNLIVTNYSDTYSKYSGLVNVNSKSYGGITASALLYDNSIGKFVIGTGTLDESDYDFSFEFDNDGYSFVVSSETNPDSYANNVLVAWKDGHISSSGKTLSDLDTSYVKRKTHSEGVTYVYTETKNGQSSLRCKSSLNFTTGENYSSIPYRNATTQSFHIGTVDFNNDDNNNYPLTVGSAKNKLTLKSDFDILSGQVGDIYTDLHVLIGDDTDKSARQIAKDEVYKLVEGAPDTYNSFKEIYEWINTHGIEVSDIYGEFDNYVKKITSTDARYAYVNDKGTEGKIRIIYNVGSSEQATIDKGGKPYTIYTIPCRNHYGGITVTDPREEYDAVNLRTLERYIGKFTAPTNYTPVTYANKAENDALGQRIDTTYAKTNDLNSYVLYSTYSSKVKELDDKISSVIIGQVPIATYDSAGIVKPDGILQVDESGTLSIPHASSDHMSLGECEELDGIITANEYDILYKTIFNNVVSYAQPNIHGDTYYEYVIRNVFTANCAEGLTDKPLKTYITDITTKIDTINNKLNNEVVPKLDSTYDGLKLTDSGLWSLYSYIMCNVHIEVNYSYISTTRPTDAITNYQLHYDFSFVMNAGDDYQRRPMYMSLSDICQYILNSFRVQGYNSNMAGGRFRRTLARIPVVITRIGPKEDQPNNEYDDTNYTTTITSYLTIDALDLDVAPTYVGIRMPIKKYAHEWSNMLSNDVINLLNILDNAQDYSITCNYQAFGPEGF